MPRSDPSPETRPRPDWRAWIILAWALSCGLLYGKMVIEQRGGKIKELVGGPTAKTPRTPREERDLGRDEAPIGKGGGLTEKGEEERMY